MRDMNDDFFNYDSFAADVRKHFQNNHLTYRKAAEELKLDEATVRFAAMSSEERRRIDRRRGRMPGLRVVCKIASFCGLFIDDYVVDVFRDH